MEDSFKSLSEALEYFTSPPLIYQACQYLKEVYHIEEILLLCEPSG